MQNTGIGLGALLIAGGAVLKWAVTYDAEGIDLNQVGLILFIVGIALTTVSIVMAATGNRTTVRSDRETVVDGRPVVQRDREVVVERDLD